MHPKHLADMISSRICHDLISPVGAISNGVELMQELNGPSPEMELISQSAENAQAKLMFFRVAFGASSVDAMVSHTAAASVAQKMFANGRISVEFSEPWGDRNRNLVKLLYLLLLCVESSLPRGGLIRCLPTDSGWEISVKNDRLDPPETLWKALLNGDAFGQLASQEIQFLLARDIAETINITLTAQFSPSTLSLRF